MEELLCPERQCDTVLWKDGREVERLICDWSEGDVVMVQCNTVAMGLTVAQSSNAPLASLCFFIVVVREQ